MVVQYLYATEVIAQNDHDEAHVPRREDKVVRGGDIYRVADVEWHPLENRAVVRLTKVVSLW